MRRALAVVQRAPCAFTMPAGGAVRVHVTYTPGEEPKWSVEPLRAARFQGSVNLES